MVRGAVVSIPPKEAASGVLISEPTAWYPRPGPGAAYGAELTSPSSSPSDPQRYTGWVKISSETSGGKLRLGEATKSRVVVKISIHEETGPALLSFQNKMRPGLLGGGGKGPLTPHIPWGLPPTPQAGLESLPPTFPPSSPFSPGAALLLPWEPSLIGPTSLSFPPYLTIFLSSHQSLAFRAKGAE